MLEKILKKKEEKSLQILTRDFGKEISLNKKRVEEITGYMLSTLGKQRDNSLSIQVHYSVKILYLLLEF